MTCYILVMWSFSSRHHSMVMDPEMLARLVFCFENNPERHDGIISGAQDSIGICVPGLVRHYYDNNFWPEKIESTQDEMTLRFLEGHLVMIPMEPRRPGCSVVEGKDITPEKVKALADAADACWKAILAHDLDAFSAAYRASFEAQIAMFPGMVNPSYQRCDRTDTKGITIWCPSSSSAASSSCGALPMASSRC